MRSLSAVFSWEGEAPAEPPPLWLGRSLALPRCGSSTSGFDNLELLQRALHGLEQIGDTDAQTQGDAVKRFNRRRVLAQLDLRQIA